MPGNKTIHQTLWVGGTTIFFCNVYEVSHNDGLALTYFGRRIAAAPPLESRCADTTADAPALTGVSVRRLSRATDTCLPLWRRVSTPWRPPLAHWRPRRLLYYWYGHLRCPERSEHRLSITASA